MLKEKKLIYIKESDNMTYQEFKNKYNGKYVDVDGYPSKWKYQCFDLVQKYITECLGLPSNILAGCGNVCNMLKQPKLNLLKQYFDEVPLNSMCPGDIVIWEWNHIAIFDKWDGHRNWYFSQNPNPSQIMTIRQDGQHAFRKKGTATATKRYINIPPTIEARNVYYLDKNVVKAQLKPKKFGGLTYTILNQANGYATIETGDFGKVRVRITAMTPITTSPKYEYGNW